MFSTAELSIFYVLVSRCFCSHSVGCCTLVASSCTSLSFVGVRFLSVLCRQPLVVYVFFYMHSRSDLLGFDFIPFTDRNVEYILCDYWE